MEPNDQNKRPESRDQLPGWYAQVLEKQATSGMSVAKYAAEIGVTAATLYQWKRRLGRDSGDNAEYETPASMGLVEVSLPRGLSTCASRNLVVRLGNGRSVEVPRRFDDDDDLIRLLSLLESC